MKEAESTAKKRESRIAPFSREKGLARGIFLLPNLITTGALFSSFYAVIAAMQGAFEIAAIAVVIAGFLDALDGRIARLTNTQSPFGEQYDSLSDLVAFGVAPAVLMYSWVLSGLGKLGWMIAFLYLACVALRLARFNSTPENKGFVGLASPAAAGTVSTLVWTWVDNLNPVVDLPLTIFLAAFIVVVALLMVSNIQYYSPKYINLKGRVPFIYIVGGVLLFVVVATYPPGILLSIGLVYCASGPLWLLYRRVQKSGESPESE